MYSWHRLQLMPVRRRENNRQHTIAWIHSWRRRQRRALGPSACQRLHKETVLERFAREIPEGIQSRRGYHPRESISHPTSKPLVGKPYPIPLREQEKPRDTKTSKTLLYTIFPTQHHDLSSFMVAHTCNRRRGGAFRDRNKRDSRKFGTLRWKHCRKPNGRTYRISQNNLNFIS